MRITVCQLPNDPDELARDWDRLVAHVRAEASELVLLPEMPFYPWIGATRPFQPAVWQAALEAHDAWQDRLAELKPAAVVGSRPVERQGRRLNEGFLWQPGNGYQAVHHKYYLPDEPGFWEASWYQRGEHEFRPTTAGPVGLGMLICTEIWFTEHARTYARTGAHLLACPRAVEAATLDKWIAGGRVAAVMAGAYCLSSNRGGIDRPGQHWAGAGWIIEPEQGAVLAVTSADQPFVTRDLDLGLAEAAKATYPRYILE